MTGHRRMAFTIPTCLLGAVLIGFCAAPAANAQTDRLSFCVIGDTQSLAEQLRGMVAQMVALKPDLVVIPGDVVAARGGDPAPWDRFFDICAPLATQPNRTLYAVPGNHDMDGGRTAALFQWRNRWDLPGNKLFYSFERGPAKFVGVFTNLAYDGGGLAEMWPVDGRQVSQIEWLEKELARGGDGPWKFLFFHEPESCCVRVEHLHGEPFGIYGVGVPGPPAEQETLAFAAGVDIVFRGHHHLYQRTYPMSLATGLRDDARGMAFITTGGGHSDLSPRTPDEVLPAQYDAVIGLHRAHFCHVVVEGNRLEFEAIDIHGQAFDRFTITKNPDGTRMWTDLPDRTILLPGDTGIQAQEDDGGEIEPAVGTLAFVSDRDGDFEVYLMHPDGSGQRWLTNNSARDMCPTWSPDGRKIAFVSDRDGNLEIYVMNADGTDQRNLTNDFSDDWGAVWSPDGTRIGFARGWNPDPSDIWVMNSDGTGQTNLTDNPADEELPVWSPDGTQIAFIRRTQGGNSEIWRMEADGTGPMNLTNHPSFDSRPIWSPDGKRIAFVSNRDRNYDIYMMNPDGTEPANVRNDPSFVWGPAWSPDGKKIAFVKGWLGTGEIHAMSADGGQERNLTHDPADDWGPTWSPDGTRIAFVRKMEWENAKIFVMNSDGIGQMNLTHNGAYEFAPAWSPAP